MANPTGISKITRSYQISIPPEIRKKLDLNIGDYVAFVEKDGEFYVTKVTV